MRKLLLFSLFALLASAMSWATTETWVKVTSTPDSWDGDYLIVYEDGKIALNGSASTLSEKSQDKSNIEVKISNNTISLDDAYCFTIKESTTSGQYAIISKSGLQIGHKGSSNTLSTGDNYTNTLSIDNNGNAVITSCQTTTYTLKYNTNPTRFCYYKSTCKMNAIALYKKQEGPAPEPTQVAAPTFSVKDGATVGYGSQVTVSSAEGTNLVVSYGDVKDENVGSNTKTITLPTEGETYTISAYAVDPTGVKSDSEKVTVTYNLLNLNVANIKEFLSKKGTTLTYTFTNPVTVIGQYTTKQGSDLYVKDSTGYLLIYNPGITGLVNGDIIEAGFSGVYEENSGLPQLTDPANLVKSETAGTAVEPTAVTIDELEAAYYSEYVSLKKVKYDGTNFVDLNDETQKITAYNNKYNLVTLEAGKVYNVTGIYTIYYTTKEILPLTAKNCNT